MFEISFNWKINWQIFEKTSHLVLIMSAIVGFGKYAKFTAQELVKKDKEYANWIIDTF